MKNGIGTRRDWYPLAVAQVERFNRKWLVVGECNEWQAHVDKDGYGRFALSLPDSKQIHVRAHRVALALKLGRVPDGLVLHSCDNARCVRPEHLSEGTQSRNLEECAARGRRRSVRLTPSLVRQIRERVAAGETVTSIASDYPCSREAIYGVVHLRTWRNV